MKDEYKETEDRKDPIKQPALNTKTATLSALKFTSLAFFLASVATTIAFLTFGPKSLSVFVLKFGLLGGIAIPALLGISALVFSFFALVQAKQISPPKKLLLFFGFAFLLGALAIAYLAFGIIPGGGLLPTLSLGYKVAAVASVGGMGTVLSAAVLPTPENEWKIYCIPALLLFATAIVFSPIGIFTTFSGSAILLKGIFGIGIPAFEGVLLGLGSYTSYRLQGGRLSYQAIPPQNSQKPALEKSEASVPEESKESAPKENKGPKTKPSSQFGILKRINKLRSGYKRNTVIKLTRIYPEELKKPAKEYYTRHDLHSKLKEEQVKRETEIVLASKFARLIERDYFASEHLLDTGQAVSRALPDEAIPYCYPDSLTQQACSLLNEIDTPKPMTKEEKSKKLCDYWARYEKTPYVAGLGVIDEVSYFIGEHDGNTENLMYSKEAFDEEGAHFIKLDYDHCFPFTHPTDKQDQLEPYSPPITFSDEELGPDRKTPVAVYGKKKECYKNIRYLEERLSTRERIAKISDEAVETLIRKHMHPNWEAEIQNAIGVMQRKIHTAKKAVEPLRAHIARYRESLEAEHDHSAASVVESPSLS